MNIYFTHSCEMVRSPSGQSAGWYFKAWCALRPLLGPDLVTEPQEPVYFEFGETQEEALIKLGDSVRALYAPISLNWILSPPKFKGAKPLEPVPWI